MFGKLTAERLTVFFTGIIAVTGTRRADTDLEEIKDAGAHGFSTRVPTNDSATDRQRATSLRKEMRCFPVIS